MITRIRSSPVVFRSFGWGLNSGLNRTACNLQFAEIRTPGKLFDRGSIHVAGGEIHFPKGAAVSQHAIDEVYTFENFRPIHVGHVTHARDDVADGRVGCDLSLLFIADRIFRGPSACGQQLVYVGEEGFSGRTSISQPVDELNQKCVG